ncbi:hypothetical protein CLD20_13920 [Afifella sp. IM 167]|nr:hypothetical protein [Afifella sp. IM 167]
MWKEDDRESGQQTAGAARAGDTEAPADRVMVSAAEITRTCATAAGPGRRGGRMEGASAMSEKIR